MRIIWLALIPAIACGESEGSSGNAKAKGGAESGGVTSTGGLGWSATGGTRAGRGGTGGSAGTRDNTGGISQGGSPDGGQPSAGEGGEIGGQAGEPSAGDGGVSTGGNAGGSAPGGLGGSGAGNGGRSGTGGASGAGSAGKASAGMSGSGGTRTTNPACAYPHDSSTDCGGSLPGVFEFTAPADTYCWKIQAQRHVDLWLDAEADRCVDLNAPDQTIDAGHCKLLWGPSSPYDARLETVVAYAKQTGGGRPCVQYVSRALFESAPGNMFCYCQ